MKSAPLIPSRVPSPGVSAGVAALDRLPPARDVPQSVVQFVADIAKLYRAFLEATLPYLAGETDAPPLAAEAWIEPEMCALAAQRSWLNDDREVALADVSGGHAYDGKAFAESYRKARYPNGW